MALTFKLKFKRPRRLLSASSASIPVAQDLPPTAHLRELFCYPSNLRPSFPDPSDRLSSMLYPLHAQFPDCVGASGPLFRVLQLYNPMFHATECASLLAGVANPLPPI
ncbi:hypothetical protein HYPSUDRAFT_208468 [Hypholoma sublateritium FD-334 SS-4]|uniref:Uncharacterized protein n=1 Tax=Hypholoma sublateritium (strain FD-334 SS-4) TaxID=945553 RepID=A0A0D2P2H8_HYPSF|nr:hypothetical protein HYPSUDRAFT_208468 [Hypholoma sublateritium FD-334 SS-4]